TQCFESTELQLLHSPFCAPKVKCDFAYALLLSEAHVDHATLIFRKSTYELKQASAAFDAVENGFFAALIDRLVRLRKVLLASLFRSWSDDGLGGDLVQPRRERSAPPFEPFYVCERLVKNVRGQVLNVDTIAHAARDVSIHAAEIPFVELGEPAWIFLCC